jgi:RNA-binding protein
VQLTGKQKTFLRGLAHELKPVVQIGVAGLTDGVALQIDGALEIHELIKVKVAKEAPIDADAVGGPLEAIGAALAQRIGRTVVLYRPRRQDPAIRLPR